MKNTSFVFLFMNLWHAMQNGNNVVFAFSSTSLSSSFMAKTQPTQMMDRTKRSNLSMSATTTSKPKGCAARPAMKQKVAVFGAGGYLGSNIFGFLQRASSLYGTGLGGSSTPRAICATAVGSVSLNSVLSKNFKLAYASEYMVTLTNMVDTQYIQRNLKGMDAAILATSYVLETRPVTGGTYETGPNTKTNEFYMGARKRMTDVDAGNNTDLQLELFRNSIEACVNAGLKHVIIMQTNSYSNDDDMIQDMKIYAEILDETDINFTYICPDKGTTFQNVPDYTFEKGIQGNINIESFTLSKNYKNMDGYEAGDWMESLVKEESTIQSTSPTNMEDLAALVVQSLLSLDWEQKRIMKVGTSGNFVSSNIAIESRRAGMNNPLKSDRYWCNNSEDLERKLNAVN